MRPVYTENSPISSRMYRPWKNIRMICGKRWGQQNRVTGWRGHGLAHSHQGRCDGCPRQRDDRPTPPTSQPSGSRLSPNTNY